MKLLKLPFLSLGILLCLMNPLLIEQGVVLVESVQAAQAAEQDYDELDLTQALTQSEVRLLPLLILREGCCSECSISIAPQPRALMPTQSDSDMESLCTTQSPIGYLAETAQFTASLQAQNDYFRAVLRAWPPKPLIADIQSIQQQYLI